jgi:hypothetical protein
MMSNPVVLRLDRSIQLRTNRYKEICKAEDSRYRGQAAVRRFWMSVCFIYIFQAKQPIQ